MAWLRTLGTIKAYFSIPLINFTHLYKTLTLKGDPTQSPTQSSFQQLRHLIHTDLIASFHLMILQPLTPQTQIDPTSPLTTPPLDLHPDIATRIHRFAPIF